MDDQFQFYAKNELQPGSPELKNVVSSLTKAASLIHQERQEAAIAIITTMQNNVIFLHKQTLKGEMLYRQEQKTVTDAVASLVFQVGELNSEIAQIQKRIAELDVRIKAEDVNAYELQRQLAALSSLLTIAEAQRREHQRKLNELHDCSVGRIFLSILCLGLDRAIMGIKSLIEQDAARIKILMDEINRYRTAMASGESQLKVARQLQMTLRDEQKRNETQTQTLTKTMEKLHQEEKSVRIKLAAITEVAAFYGKLRVICESVRKNILWVLDIIEELNDDQPRIVDIDASHTELVPLRTALAKLDDLLSSDRVQANFANNEALSIA